MKELFYGHNKYTGKFDRIEGKGRSFRSQFRGVSFLGIKELVDGDFDGKFNWALYFKGTNDELLCIGVSHDAFNPSNMGTLREGEISTVASIKDGKSFGLRITTV